MKWSNQESYLLAIRVKSGEEKQKLLALMLFE